MAMKNHGGPYRDQQQFYGNVTGTTAQSFRPQYNPSPSASPSPSHHQGHMQNSNEMKPPGSMPQNSDFGHPPQFQPGMAQMFRAQRPQAPFYNGTARPQLPPHVAHQQMPFVYPPMGPMSLLSNSSGQLFMQNPGNTGFIVPNLVQTNGQPPSNQPPANTSSHDGVPPFSVWQYGPGGPAPRQPLGGPRYNIRQALPRPYMDPAMAMYYTGMMQSQSVQMAPAQRMPVPQPPQEAVNAQQMAPQQQQQPPQQVQHEQQPQPQPTRGSKRLAITNPETGEDVIDRYLQESKTAGYKDRAKIDIRSPSGEVVSTDSMVHPAEEGSPPAQEAPQPTAGDLDNAESVGPSIPQDDARTSNLVEESQSAVKPDEQLPAEVKTAPVDEPSQKGPEVESSEPVAEIARPRAVSVEVQEAKVNGEVASPEPIEDVGKATQRPKEKPGSKAKWETKGTGDELDAFNDPPAVAAPVAADPQPEVPAKAEEVVEEAALEVADPPAPAKSPSPPSTAARTASQSPSPAPTPTAPPTTSYLTKLKYEEGQYRPDFPEGRRVYADRDFLLILKGCPSAMRFPDHLVESPKLDILKATPDGRSKLSTGGQMGGGGGGGPSGGQFADFTPSFIARGGSGGQPGPPGGMMFSRDQRGSTQGVPKRSSMGRRGGPQQQKNQQQMVINLSVDEPKLQRDPNAWKPGKVVDTAETTEQAKLYKNVRGILNKLTPQKFDTLVGQVKELEITELPVLLKVIDMVFEKACDEPGFATAYARMCRELSTKMRVQTEDGQEVYFRKALLMKCQREFEAERLYDENRDEKLIEIEKAETDEKRKELQLDLEDKDRKMKRRYLGTIRFIGELFVMSMLTVKIMHECVARLLSGWHKRKDEDSLECLCKLLTTIGAKMEDPGLPAGASKNASVIPDHQEKMKNYFNQMQSIVEAKDTSSRVRFMLLDSIDLRANKWVPRREIAGPKTIDQIHKEAEAEEAKKNIAINEAKARQREKDREARERPRDRANMGPGSRGSQQGQQQDDWTRVEATKKHERQNQMDRKNFDPSRLQSMSLSSGAMSFGPQGGGSFWKSGSGAGGGAGSSMGRSGDSGNKFAALSDDRNRQQNQNLPPRLRHQQEQQRHQGRGFRGPESGVRPSSSMGSSRDNSSNRGDDGRGGRFGPTASMVVPRGGDRDRDAESVSLGPHRGAPPGAPFAPSGGRGPGLRPSPSTGGGSKMKGSATASADECKELGAKITSKHCVPASEVTTDESVAEIVDKFHESTLHFLIHGGLNTSVEKKEPFRRAFGTLLARLVEKGYLTVPIFVKGVTEFVTFADADGLQEDVPKLWSYVGECLGPIFVQSSEFSLVALKNAEMPHLGPILAGVVHAVSSQFSEDEALTVWQKSGLSPEDLAPADRVDEFLRREKIEFLKSGPQGEKPKGENEWASEKSTEKFRQELSSLLRTNPPPGNDDIIQWVDKRVPPDSRTENHFIRALTYVILDVAMGPGETSEAIQFSKEKFLARAPVLMRFNDARAEAEMQSLIAACHICADKNHPRGLVTELFEALDDSELIAEESFNKWYQDGTGIRGYGIAHEAVKQFFTWLNTAPTEEENQEAKTQ